MGDIAMSSHDSVTQSPLCIDCRKALDLWGSKKDVAKAGDGRPSRGPPETVLLQVNSRLIDRVATGCRLCTMIYESFEGETRTFEGPTFRTKRHDSDLDEKPETWGYMRSWRSGGPPNDVYQETDISIRRWRPRVDMDFSVRLHRVRDRGCKDCSGGTPNEIETKNSPPWDLMKKWLKECTETHQKPCKPAASSFIPSRLLNVGTLLDPIIRLELREDIYSGTEYFTLSHCWGPIVPKRLLLENLSEFRKDISTDGLSKTFKEAIYATRMLGMQYIWVDSLCIIQNSAEDWQEEAKMMGQVYASGLCNLAATGASEGSQGLYLDKLPTPQVLIEINDAKELWHLTENPGYHWPDILNFAPLNWRGWVFQERFLSTRVIHFGQSRVYWECGTKNCCEWTGHTEEWELNSNGHTAQAKSYWQKILNGSATVDQNEAVKMWNAIVDHYSSHSAFTYVTDKLLAIAGLAARVRKSTKCRYFAGFWEHGLPSQLMWDVGKEGADTSPVSSFVAPSWSWASINVPIERYKRFRPDKYIPSPTIEILKVDIDLVTGNELGQIRGGSMTLTGRLGVVENFNVFKERENGELEFEAIVLRLDRKRDSEKDVDAQLYLLLVEDQHTEEYYEGAGVALQRMGENDLKSRMSSNASGSSTFGSTTR